MLEKPWMDFEGWEVLGNPLGQAQGRYANGSLGRRRNDESLMPWRRASYLRQQRREWWEKEVGSQKFNPKASNHGGYPNHWEGAQEVNQEVNQEIISGSACVATFMVDPPSEYNSSSSSKRTQRPLADYELLWELVVGKQIMLRFYQRPHLPVTPITITYLPMHMVLEPHRGHDEHRAPPLCGTKQPQMLKHARFGRRTLLGRNELPLGVTYAP
ncbi:MAG: hypothetical protein L6R35_000530 [Caloplaca aegaea]|nr:MAG: hypothetical protein L6R35_000530 [Caloplaca aegaea]